MPYGHLNDGDPFVVHARREGGDSELVVLTFECRDGLGLLGIRKPGRTDPQPSLAAEESGVDPGLLRSGRFVHVLGSGQRQSYALSRITPEIAARLPDSRWVQLESQTEYGFRYLVVPENALGPAPGGPPPSPEDAPEAEPRQASSPAGPLPPRQTPMAPALAEAALKALSREQLAEALKGEMAKVHLLHDRVAELEEALGRAKGRERDLLELLARWQA